MDAEIEGNRPRLKDLIHNQEPIKNHPEPILNIYWEIMLLNENSYIFRRPVERFLMSFLSLTVTFDEFAVALEICIFRWATTWG